MKNKSLICYRSILGCTCLVLSMFGCSDDNSLSSECTKTHESCASENQIFDEENCVCIPKECGKSAHICAADNKLFDAEHCECIAPPCDKNQAVCSEDNKLFDAEHCECIAKPCDKNQPICARDNKIFDAEHCECIGVLCDKDEEICSAENQLFDEENCDCVGVLCDKSKYICAGNNKLFNADTCECYGILCDKSSETCAAENRLFDANQCECYGIICDKNEESCAEEGKLFDEENCICAGRLCRLSPESCAEEYKSFDEENCVCTNIECSTEENCRSENKVFNPDTCLCDLVCDGVRSDHKLSPVLDYLKYSEFGAVGNGMTDDMKAIRNTHACANKYHLKVKGDIDANYYIGVITDDGAIIKTDTDWTGSSFTIDDSNVNIELRGKNIFNVRSEQQSKCLVGNSSDCANQLKTLTRHQENIGITLPKKSIVVLKNDNVKQYIREGLNQNEGTSQTDIIVVDENGNVDQTAPIMWDYQEITSAWYTPVDEDTLTIKGGTFTTIANQAPSEYTYYGRGINIQRSNVVIEGFTHYVTNELKHGAPYNGFLTIMDCANILVKNCTFTGHKIYKTIGSAGSSVSMGTYDIAPARVIHLTFDACNQTNSILDKDYWGIIGSNFCKDIVVKNSEFSRFDAHQGVANVTIINSKLGHQGLNAIGEGVLKIENSTLYGTSFINLRDDYGSTWRGNVEIKNSTWVPKQGNLFITADLISGRFSGEHDFGYECYMPETIDIDGLYVDDSNRFIGYKGIYLLADIIENDKNEAFESSMKYKYHVTKNINIKNYTSDSGKKWILSSNMFMYRNVVVNEQ